MTRRLALAWASGASLGLVVGFLAGESVRDGLTLRHLARPEPRTGLPAGTSATGATNGPQIGVQPLIPSQRDDEPCPVTLGPLTCPFRGQHTNHAFQSGTWAPDAKDDADEEVE